MKNVMMLLLAVAALGFVACEAGEAHEHEHAEEAVDMDALKAEIQAMEDAYAKAQMAKDAAGVVAYYADDAVSLGADEPALVGKAAIQANIQSDMDKDSTTSAIKYTVVDLFASGNLAVEVGKGVTTHADGSTRDGKYVSIFEKRDGKWICIRDIYNNDAPEED